MGRTASALPPLAGFAFTNFLAPDILSEIGRRLPAKYEAIFAQAAELGLHSPLWVLGGLNEQGEEVLEYSYRAEGAQGTWQFGDGHICPFGKCQYTRSGTIARACLECELACTQLANWFSVMMHYASGAVPDVVVTERQEERTYLYNTAGRTPAEREKTREVVIRRLERANHP